MQTHDLQTPYLSVVIPAYNEEERIEMTIRETFAFLAKQSYRSEVLVVLNRCSDGTLDVVLSLEKEFSSLRHLDLGLLPNIEGTTKGFAVTKGMLNARGENILFMDADNATPVSEVDRLIPHLKTGYDVVIGSRRARGAQVLPQAWYRVLLGMIGNLLIQAILLPGISDTQCGFKLFTKKAADDIFNKSVIAGWGFDMELLALARKKGYKIKEVGVVWRDVVGSHIHVGSYGETLKELFSIRKRIMDK